jgi:hypothetical protein
MCGLVVKIVISKHMPNSTDLGSRPDAHFECWGFTSWCSLWVLRVHVLMLTLSVEGSRPDAYWVLRVHVLMLTLSVEGSRPDAYFECWGFTSWCSLWVLRVHVLMLTLSVEGSRPDAYFECWGFTSWCLLSVEGSRPDAYFECWGFMLWCSLQVLKSPETYPKSRVSVY